MDIEGTGRWPKKAFKKRFWKRFRRKLFKTNYSISDFLKHLQNIFIWLQMFGERSGGCRVAAQKDIQEQIL